MKTLQKTLIICLAFGLVACAPSTMQGVRQNYSGKYTFTAPSSYQAVYRTVLHQARTCFAGGAITAQSVVNGDLYTDIESGNISVALHGGFGVATYLVVDIKKRTETSATVTVYNSLSTWADSAKSIKSWVLDGTTQC